MRCTHLFALDLEHSRSKVSGTGAMSLMRHILPMTALTFSLAATLVWAGAPLDDDDLAKELPRIKFHEPAEALKTFQLHAGFRLEPLAVEPLVADPIALCYDADGRMYVVEMHSYPYTPTVPGDVVRLLDDTDGDGKIDRSTVFLDRLSWPSSVVPYDGGLFVADAPDLFYVKDTDGDGKADLKKVVFTGFGTRFAEQALNGLVWGPDGWIYGSGGGNGGVITNPGRPDLKPVSIRGRDFRFKPDGSALEAISGGGQFGHSFDDWGHRFVCNNSNHIRQIVLPAHDLARNPALAAGAVLTDIAVEGGAAPVFRISPPEPWRLVRTRQRAADPSFVKRLSPTELVPTGFFTGASGVTIYRGTAFPPEYHGNAFIGDVAGNLVHRKILTRHGAIFQATRADQNVEFLASTDNWFRPVNFANTPDGTLVIMDMYRETIEQPESIPEAIKKHLDFKSGVDRGRLYHLVPEGFQKRRRPALSKATTSELVGLLADRDAWWRETAQRLLIERRDPAARSLLEKLAAARPNALGRVHALWTLDVLGGLNPELLLTAMADAEPAVREQAARLTEGRATIGPALRDALFGLAEDPDAMVRFQTALALGAVPDPKAIAALATIAVHDAADPWTRTAVLSSIGGRERALIAALTANPSFFAQPAGRLWLGELAVLVGATNKATDTQALLDQFAGPQADPGQARVVVLGLGRGLQRAGGSLRSFLNGPAAAQLAPLFERAARVAADEGETPARIDAIRLLGLGPVDSALNVLPPLLDARQPVAAQLAALQTMADLPDHRVAASVIEHWKALSPTVRREAIEVLFARADRITTLLDAIDAKTIAVSELDPIRRKQLLTVADRAVRSRAEKLLGSEAKSDRAPVISAYRQALDLESDRDRGRAVFLKACATCHRAENQGVQIGPDLATVTGRSPDDLLVHILDPNREVAPNYVNYTVATADGRVVTGLIADETAGAVTLKRAEGATDVVPRSRIEEIASTGLSLMPEGLEKEIDAQGMADLIAYLRSLQAGNPPPAPPR
jgi:putative membrane-bound dehydrogenase-like protein